MKTLLKEASPIIVLISGILLYVIFLKVIISIDLLPETVNGIIQ